jgi:hypothetical protein
MVVFFLIFFFVPFQCVADDKAGTNLAEVQAHFNNVEQSRNSVPLYLTSYLPAVMQAVAYYIDQLQYTQSPLPSQDQPSTARPQRPTTKPPQRTTTTRRTTRRTSTVSPIESK